MMQEWVYDIETDGLKPTKVWCLGASQNDPDKVNTTTSYQRMRDLVERPDVALIAHNGVCYDIPVLKRLLKANITATLVDTLSLSWYLYPTRVRHGLADWGEEFGIPKPVVEDWEDQPIEVYLHRVREDVKINTLLWQKMKKDLLQIYDNDEAEVWRLIRYLSYKMDCAAEQERLGWRLDIPRAEAGLAKVSKIKEERFAELIKVMPSVPIKKTKKLPAKPYKKSGELSAHGAAWFDLIKELGLPSDTLETEIIDGYKVANPASHVQMKSWLFSLGWIPETFEFKRNKETGDVKQIPQISIKNSGGELCPSIQKLFRKEPKLEALAGLSIATHRISIFEGFLNNVNEHGYLYAGIQGLTNTLRFKHRVLVNLPAVDKPYGDDVRGCLIAPEGYVLCGSDMSSLEDRTGMHYQYPLDPEYVESKSSYGYDPHTTMAIAAGMITKEEEEFYKWYQENH